MMHSEEIKKRKEKFKELCNILVRRHGQNFFSSYNNNRRVTIDEKVERFGRYLRAARLNHGLSVAELAAQTRISEATQLALEQGIILSCDIKPKWLKDLARALDENIEIFNLLLGREINQTSRWSWLTASFFDYKNLIYQIRPRRWPFTFVPARVHLLSKPIYAVCSAMFLCITISMVIFVGTTPFMADQPPIRARENSFINVNAEHRLNRIQAEFDFERQAFISQADIVHRRSCCVY